MMPVAIYGIFEHFGTSKQTIDVMRNMSIIPIDWS